MYSMPGISLSIQSGRDRRICPRIYEGPEVTVPFAHSTINRETMCLARTKEKVISQNIEGKVVVITGASSGPGAVDSELKKAAPTR